jgi:hypothetical protein
VTRLTFQTKFQNLGSVGESRDAGDGAAKNERVNVMSA